MYDIKNNEKRKKESSLILRKAKFQAIFKFDLSSASGGAGGGKYNRIPAFVLMSVLLIRRSLEKFFKKNFRDDSFCFGFAKVLAFALLFTIATTAESRADDLAPTSGTCNSSGTCLWNLSSDGTLNIYAAPNSKDVVMDHYRCIDSTGIGNRPWEQNIIKIKNLVVGDNITNIGGEAFQNALNLETVKGMKDVKTIGFDCFVGTAKLQTIETPSVETLDNFALESNSPYLKSVDLPNIKNMGYRSMPYFLEFVGLPSSNVSVNNSFMHCIYISNCSNENRAACGSCGDGYVMRGLGCVPDCGAGYLGKEGRCIDASNGCGAGYRQFENFCNRIQYTPAEAAEVLKDDNTNSVTITFKK